MKVIFAAFAVAALALSAGPTAVLPEMSADDQTAASLPSWIVLPGDHAVMMIEFSGEMGVERSRGQIIVDAEGHGGDALAALRQRYADAGFVVSPISRGLDNFMGGLEVSLAVDPATGRSVEVTHIERPAGSLLSLSFKDPMARI